MQGGTAAFQSQRIFRRKRQESGDKRLSVEGGLPKFRLERLNDRITPPPSDVLGSRPSASRTAISSA
jgi:hypothetical protein